MRNIIDYKAGDPCAMLPADICKLFCRIPQLQKQLQLADALADIHI